MSGTCQAPGANSRMARTLTDRSTVRRMPRCALALAAAAAAILALALPALAPAEPLDFTVPSYVDQQLAGGEPLLFTDPVHHTLVYSSHEGTTHVYRPGLASQTTFTFLGGYRNQVNVWTSKDNGLSWQRSNFAGTGFTQDPSQNSGFSDPDLSQDDGGRIYNTGINLASDALFSSNDGGVTWDQGTAQCSPGDRPWVVGAKKDEVFFATNTLQDTLSQRVFRSSDRKSTRLNSSHANISYAVFCLKKKKI